MCLIGVDMFDKRSKIIFIIVIVVLASKWIIADINQYHAVHKAMVKDKVYNFYFHDGYAYPVNDDCRDLSDLF